MLEIAPDGMIFRTPLENGLIVKTIERINDKSQLIPRKIDDIIDNITLKELKNMANSMYDLISIIDNVLLEFTGSNKLNKAEAELLHEHFFLIFKDCRDNNKDCFKSPEGYKLIKTLMTNQIFYFSEKLEKVEGDKERLKIADYWVNRWDALCLEQQEWYQLQKSAGTNPNLVAFDLDDLNSIKEVFPDTE